MGATNCRGQALIELILVLTLFVASIAACAWRWNEISDEIQDTGYRHIRSVPKVGLVTLIGLISKHGILIVQFANDLQKAGQSKRQAIEHSAAIRLRPILMTTAAMVLGVVPLILATGAGAV